MSEYKKDDITLLCTDRMAYMRSLPDNAFDLAVVDPPYSRAGGTVTRTGGTWSSKYGKAIRDWDVAPSEDYFNELFRVSRNQIIWGGGLFQPTTDKMFSCMAKAVNFRGVLNGYGRVCVDFV